MKFSIPFARVNWVTSIFLAVTLFTSLIGAPIYIAKFGLDWFQVSMFFFYVIATGMSITLGYHRLFAHKAFKAKRPVRLATLIFGACAFENSALDWASDHRDHHKHVDRDDDPYNINKGFWWAHIGWLIFKLTPEDGRLNVPDLKKDRLVMWQHQYTQLIAVVVGLLLPALLGFLWDGWIGALGGFLIAGVTRVVVVQHSTFFINSLCHTIGNRPYDKGTSARDSWIMALLTFGEGYHNYHHTFQHDYRNGVRKLAFDPTKWAIWTLSKMGLASELRRVSPEKILLAEMKQARERVTAQMAAFAALKEARQSLVDCPRYRAASEALTQISETVTRNYHELEEAVGKRMKVSRKALKEWREETRGLMEHMAEMSQLAMAPAH